MTPFSTRLLGLKLREVFLSHFKIPVTCSRMFVLVSEWILVLCLNILLVTSEGASSWQHWPHREYLAVTSTSSLKYLQRMKTAWDTTRIILAVKKTSVFLLFCRSNNKNKRSLLQAWVTRQSRHDYVVWESFLEGSSSSERFRFFAERWKFFLGQGPAIKACGGIQWGFLSWQDYKSGSWDYAKVLDKQLSPNTSNLDLARGIMWQEKAHVGGAKNCGKCIKISYHNRANPSPRVEAPIPH